ncbi:MAG: hypothetical protein ACREPT_02645 [Rudaea sp.]
MLGDIIAALLRSGRDRPLDSGFVRNLYYARVNAGALPFAVAHYNAGKLSLQ